MMKIIHFFAGDLQSVSLGGISNYIKEIFTNSDSQKVEYFLVGVTLYDREKVGEWTKLKIKNSEINFFPVLSVNKNHSTYEGGFPLNFLYLLRIFKYRNIILRFADCLHFHRFEHSLPFIFVSRKRINPFVLTIHGNNLHLQSPTSHKLFKRKWFLFLFHKLEKFIIPRMNKIILVSEDAVAIYLELFPSLKERFIHLPTFIDLNFFKPLEKEICRKKLGLNLEKKVILFAGRFDEAKGLDLLLEAFFMFREREEKERFLLVLVGDGGERIRLQKRVEVSQANNVIFYNYIPYSEMPQIMNCADVFVLTSIWEGMPLVMLEALACNIPVVATEVGQIKAVIKEGYNGFLIKQRTPSAVKASILKAIAFSDLLRNNCRDSVNMFSASLITNKIEKLYFELLLTMHSH